jgi:hypothetical protein
MNLTRQQFCASLAGATVTLWLQGCGGGGYSDPGPPAAGARCGASGSDISGNHGHALTILKADLDSVTDRTFSLTPSTEGHVHSVTFTAVQLAALKAGSTVNVVSTTTAASTAYGGTHSHTVSAAVAVASCA